MRACDYSRSAPARIRQNINEYGHSRRHRSEKVSLGDEVVLFGKQGNAEIQAEEIEDLSGALFTEMSILWGATNKRILVD